jgi:hypothetical protein
MADRRGSVNENGPALWIIVTMRYTQDSVDWSIQVAELGYGITPTRFRKARLQSVFDALESLEPQRSRAGIRHILKHSAVCDIANSKELLEVAASALGGNAVAFRATLFKQISQIELARRLASRRGASSPREARNGRLGPLVG